VLFDHLAHDARTVLGVAHVALVDARAPRAVRQRSAECVGPLPVGREAGRDRRPATGEIVANGGTDAARASGDERHTSRQRFLRRSRHDATAVSSARPATAEPSSRRSAEVAAL
jgi:hypothetical protein